MDEHKLFVGNMAARITQRDLWRFFSSYGLIDECAKFHESYAFVRFVHAADAQRARQQTHGAILKGRKLKVEFAAAANKTNSSTSNQQRYVYIQPLRRNVNMPSYSPRPISTPKLSDDKLKTNEIFPIESSKKSDEFFTPDLLRLAGIQFSSPDDGYDTILSPFLNTSSDSRFFPLSTTRQNTFTNHIDQSNDDNPLLSWDFTRIRLFSDGSSNFGDDSNLYIE